MPLPSCHVPGHVRTSPAGFGRTHFIVSSLFASRSVVRNCEELLWGWFSCNSSRPSNWPSKLSPRPSKWWFYNDDDNDYKRCLVCFIDASDELFMFSDKLFTQLERVKSIWVLCSTVDHQKLLQNKTKHKNRYIYREMVYGKNNVTKGKPMEKHTNFHWIYQNFIYLQTEMCIECTRWIQTEKKQQIKLSRIILQTEIYVIGLSLGWWLVRLLVQMRSSKRKKRAAPGWSVSSM